MVLHSFQGQAHNLGRPRLLPRQDVVFARAQSGSALTVNLGVAYFGLEHHLGSVWLYPFRTAATTRVTVTISSLFFK